ncbi:M20/M25/M40 family metallo-hydrolase [Natranaerobius thermophilus]|uniref:Peptidase T-like protein n=1 Tax=Natranaerobius thermophilus (strain ATCC BAA-1301 / DSM 18059 / JW/NM-WN-LF) TaxID=457570 RepID=B2A649_NATTJ|nr:M20/M25/M40 family metallo-hydrolase [Natranaerobius thermophilus]ACB85466.1 peptidase T-like protein [Natranaerobius thermophilus JW/NM-WN-LF]
MTNKDRLKELFFELAEIDSESGKERQMADRLKEKLRELGGDPYEDNAGEKMGTEAGNVICRIEGDNSKEPVILSAHMDTVKPGVGKKPVIEGDVIKSQGDTVLGSDDAGGIAAILEAIKTAQERNESHAPIEVVFTAYEEGGLNGSRRMDFNRLTAKKSYIFDSNGPVGTMIVEAPGQDKYDIKIKGRSAHAGLKPEDGINAIKVAAEIISDLKLGRLDDQTTANIGVIRAGEETNVVCPLAKMEGEARSRDEQRLKEVTEKMRQTCETYCEQYGAELEFDAQRLYSAYKLDQKDEVVQHCLNALNKVGLQPKYEATGGGSDANIFNANGIETVNLGMGYEKVHTTDEYIPVKELENAADLAYYLITV